MLTCTQSASRVCVRVCVWAWCVGRDTTAADDRFYEWCSPGHIAGWHIGVSHFRRLNGLKFFWTLQTDRYRRERVRKEVSGIERWLVGFLMALQAFGWHCQPRRFVCVCRREEGKLFWRANTLQWRCGLAADVNLFRSQMAAPWSLSYDVLQEIPVCRHGNSGLLGFLCQLQPSPLSARREMEVHWRL